MVKRYLRFPFWIPPYGLLGVRQYQILNVVAQMKNLGGEVSEIFLHLGLPLFS